LNISNEFWATVINFINTGEIPTSSRGAGRPSLGTTKKASLTLPDEIWKKIERQVISEGISQSQVLRNLIEAHFKTNRYGEEIVLVPIEKNLLIQIQDLSENTDEIYEDMEPEGFVHNILNSERLRLQKLQ
jgi:hypothetical protein